MKALHSFLVLFVCSVFVFGFFFVSCDQNNSPTGVKENSNAGIVKGRITYEGGSDFSGITVTLEKMSGGETAKIIAAKVAVTSREDIGKIAIAGSDAMTTVTGKAGNYQFTNVWPGEYSLTAQKTADHLAKVSNISVAAEGPTVVDVVLTATANIIGTVLLEGMDDYSGILVYIAGTSYMAMTDSEGSFTISDVPIGAYELVVNAHDYDVEKTAVTLEKAGDNVPVPVITLRKIGAIMGHVVDAVTGGPLADVIVKTMSAQVDTTDADGIFAIDNVPAGSALLSLTLSGYDVRWVEVPDIEPGEAATIPHAIKMYATGKTPPDIDPILQETHYSISGKVATSDSTGLIVTVSILKPDGTPTGISTTTDAGGNYFLPSIPYGSVKLQFDAGKPGEDWYTGQMAEFDIYLFEHYEENITFNVQVDNWGWVYFDRVTPPDYEELGIKLAEIPSGSFEREGYTITLDGFYMSTTEITQYQYKLLTGENPSSFSGNDLPVEYVTWYDAVRYCNLLSDAAGLTRCYNETTWYCNFNADGFRLPTEAEWEYACRASTTTIYYSGDTEADLANAGWYSVNSGSTTHTVGQKPANAWGLYDMHGNVWEWCNDCYGDYSSSDAVNPRGALSGSYRVLRGGSWNYIAFGCQSSSRYISVPDYRSNFGFRIVSRGVPD